MLALKSRRGIPPNTAFANYTARDGVERHAQLSVCRHASRQRSQACVKQYSRAHACRDRALVYSRATCVTPLTAGHSEQQELMSHSQCKSCAVR
eukprot:6202587-Pleurochrysis_carterae.AAC.5